MTFLTGSSQINLQDLQLDDVRALLTHGAKDSQQEAGESPTDYLQRLIDGLCELSLRDPLTGLGNRRHFRSVLERSIESVARSGESVLLLMMDIDHFKSINDTHGHLAGDQVLRGFAHGLQGNLRQSDIICRWGGEEFILLLKDTPPEQARLLAEKILQQTEQNRFDHNGTQLSITTSIGLAELHPDDALDQLIARADRALYRAKQTGRNRLCEDTAT